MSIKKPKLFFIVFIISFFSVMVLLSTFQKPSNNVLGDVSDIIGLLNSERNLKKILDHNEYALVDGVKIYNAEKNITNTDIHNEMIRLENELTNLLGPIKKTELNIIVFEEMESLRKYSNLKDVGAFYSRKNQTIAVVMQTPLIEENERLTIMNEKKELSFFIKDLRHEYTHYYVSTYLNEKQVRDLPTWFNEGLAEYVSLTMNDGEAIKPLGELIDFSLLETKSNWAKRRKTSDQLYSQSHYAIDYLIKSNGEGIIRKILDDSGELKFTESFFKNTNVEIGDLHEYMMAG